MFYVVLKLLPLCLHRFRQSLELARSVLCGMFKLSFPLCPSTHTLLSPSLISRVPLCPVPAALPELDELSMERVLEELEAQCQEKMQLAIETEEGLGIEYDEDVVCDVCRSPEGEDGNEMVFCDKCNICVHQVRTGSGKGRARSRRCWNVHLSSQFECARFKHRAVCRLQQGSPW